MQVDFSRSEELYKRALRVIPGGVNSPVRAFRSVGGNPVFLVQGEGAYVIDEDGNRFIDYVCSWGPLILGHAHPEVVKAVCEAAQRGTSFGAATAQEVELAEMITQAFPSVEKVRLVNSGTEAVMSAIRAARGYTGRSKIVKFEGCYHGHADALLAKAGSGVATFGLPDSAGVPVGVAADTLVLPYNDVKALEQALSNHGSDVACVVVEPIAGNMGVVIPEKGFLDRLRNLCNKYGIVLIFDEVITGFRVAYGGAQELFGIRADMTCLGKILGGGLPVGAYGGRREIMDVVAPEGPVYQAGTLSGNPLAVAAGIATLKALQEPGFYERLERTAARVQQGLADAAGSHSLQTCCNRVGSMMTLFFTPGPVTDYASAKTADTQLYARFFRGMLERGVYFAPSQFEAAFVSAAHSDAEVNYTLEKAAEVLASIRDIDPSS
ncbi:MAG: glutamate-1-semialdehyde 2,1-aminomutase [Armatimonadota bacterium]|nr:glutamate-1-semialdehyde 2,1-aminomutase [Armatimonadota bacterium]